MHLVAVGTLIFAAAYVTGEGRWDTSYAFAFAFFGSLIVLSAASELRRQRRIARRRQTPAQRRRRAERRRAARERKVTHA